MSDGEALRRLVVSQPDDDLPRLIYADWLDEHGQPDRAAFIRAQVEAFRAEPFSPEARHAAHHAEDIEATHYRDWTGHLEDRVIASEFVRGFVERVTVRAARFPYVAEDIFDAEPVQAVCLSRIIGDRRPTALLEPIFEVPQLTRVTTLELPGVGLGRVGELEWIALLRSLYLDGLQELSLRKNPLQPQWIEELLSGPHFPRLTGLDLSDIPHLGPAVAAAVERAPHRRLRRVNLSGVRFQSDVVKRVLASPCLREVEELRIAWMTGPGTPGPLQHLHLAWVLPWNRLRVLDLTGHEIGSGGVEELTRCPQAANLRWLGLASNLLGPAAVDALVSARHLNLYHLDVRGNGLDRDDLARLRSRFPDAVVVG
jgi:uncharacterized protein (TIGR02996 family)